MINFDIVKEVAEMYGIEIRDVEDGKGGFIIDETKQISSQFVDYAFEGYFESFDALYSNQEFSIYPDMNSGLSAA